MERLGICIYGVGGGGREALSFLFDKFKISDNYIEENIIFMVDDIFYDKSEILGMRVIRKSTFDPTSYKVVIAVHDPFKRKKMVDSLPAETIYTKIIHPTAIISNWVEIGEGSIVGPGTILTTNIKIGDHAIINLGVTIGHDCLISNFFTAEPSVNISGNCKFNECVYLGTNSSVKENISIQNNVIVGMGGVVIKDIKESGTYVGNPLRKI